MSEMTCGPCGRTFSVEDLPEDDVELRTALTELREMQPKIEAFVRLLPEPGDPYRDEDE